MKNNRKNLPEAVKEAYALVGRTGGRATFKKHGKEFMSDIGRQGALKRWSKRSDKKEPLKDKQ